MECYLSSHELMGQSAKIEELEGLAISFPVERLEGLAADSLVSRQVQDLTVKSTARSKGPLEELCQ